MCLVIAFILGIMSVNAFMAGHMALGMMTAAGSLFFALLMLRTIVKVIRSKREPHDH